MRSAGVFALLSVFFGYVTIFLIGNYNPLDMEKIQIEFEEEGIETQAGAVGHVGKLVETGVLGDYLDYKNLSIIAVFSASAVFSISSTILIVIDKLFFRKFYESPKYSAIFRRSALLVIGFLGVVGLRIFLGPNLIITFLVIFLLGLIEVFLSQGGVPDEVESSEIEGDKKESNQPIVSA